MVIINYYCLSVPVEIEDNLDKLNSASGYYNDICYTTTSANGTDISLKDRKNEFIENNKTICQDNCILEDYDYNTKKVKCSCDIKQSPSSFADMNINKSKLYQSFVDIKNIANINILHCFKLLFTKKSIIKNIASYFMIIILLIHIIFIIIFYIKQFNSLKKKIQQIFIAIKNIKSQKNSKDANKEDKKDKNDSNKNIIAESRKKIKINKNERNKKSNQLKLNQNNSLNDKNDNILKT